MTYSDDALRHIFQGGFQIETWKELVRNLFKADEIRKEPERIDDTPDNAIGYYIGAKDTADNYRIGFFHYKVEGNVRRRRVGLRRLVRSFTNPNWGLFDAAIVAFEGKDDWRLSLVSDMKGEETAPKRYTFVFGDKNGTYNTPVSRFRLLQQNGVTFRNLMEAFSVEALTKEFYNELFGWYQWAMDSRSNVSFPNDTSTEADDKEDLDIKIIRLITRLMFVWFIKQKDLVPSKLFDTAFLKTILKDFNPGSLTDGCYYNAILQNLFFATLNRAIEDEDGQRRRFAHNKQRDAKTLYRYAELFSIPEEEVVSLFASVPFLNGGLFDCLDKDMTHDGVNCVYYDGFSRNGNRFPDGRYKYRAVVPNRLFFDRERGLLSILKRYNFTIEENSHNEQQVALDPELLGKVFENLLGAFNPETQETARNESGSFYTPREIVSFMVDESLMAYLGKTDTVESLFSDDFEREEGKEEEYRQIADKLKAVKVLDPACGSGAFPMGMLIRITELLGRLQPEEDTYNLKLQLIENCLYGSDIQCIATQITKLRFFISLVCDCDKDPDKPNFGIPTLPNLETKFVTADTLIGIKRQQQRNMYEDPAIEPAKQQLADVRHRHFAAKTAGTKTSLRKKDAELREQLAKLLEDNGNFAPQDARQLAHWNPYDQNASADFFDPEWMFGITGGFDIVIGNPPYIQLQNNQGALADKYGDCGYKTLARTGDIYCLFYERGQQLLKPQGHLCFITSNKWMRAGYGEKTREFFANNTDPMLLIDFAGVRVFDSATVDVNIMLFAKAKNRHSTVCAVTSRDNADRVRNNLRAFVRQHHSVCNFASSNSWVVLSSIEQSIKQKIEKAGTPLKDWDIQINYGIKTGYNEAFIISTDKRNEILSNCADQDERKRTEELIRPILRGRDIKRYGYDWADKWLIATFPSRHYDIDDYPAVKDYLLSFGMERLEQTGRTHVINGVKIKARKRTNNKWFETQDAIGYWDLFFKPKICWKAVGRNLTFAVVEPGIFLTAPASFISAGDFNYYVLGFLCSRVAKYFIYKNSDTTGAGDIMLNIQSLVRFPVPEDKNKTEIDRIVVSLQRKYSQELQDKLDNIIYSIYGFSPDEIKEVERV